MKRAEIDAKYTWDKSGLIQSQQQFEELFLQAKQDLEKLATYKGTLGEEEKLLEFLLLSDASDLVLERLFCYCNMWQDEDLSCGEAKEKHGRMQKFAVEYSQRTAFFSVELTSIEDSKLQKMASDERFASYDRILKRAMEDKKHILSEVEENLLAGMGEIFGGFSEIFGMTNNADMKFEDVETAEGKKPLNHSTYSLYLASEDREVRRDAYKKYYAGFRQNLNHITATYAGNVKKDCFLAKTRKFSSALEKALYSEEVDEKVYRRLLSHMQECKPQMHKYISLRKRALGLEEIHYYDLYVSMVKGCNLELEYEKACQLVQKALLPLGEEYSNLLAEGFENRWVDVFYSEGKRSGAYSTGTYAHHPFVLLNYEKTTHDVFTIAHEMGHSLHTHYSNKNQPMAKAGYKIFVAEVASTVNEVLLLRHLIDTAEEEEFRKFCLNYFLDMMRTTIFRQTMFAEFEAKAHEMCENGEVLTKENLSKEYQRLGREYYGEEIVCDEDIAIEWCRIPHFYRSFYVYKYATGLISAISIAYGILENGKPNVESYLEFLKSGCCKKPTELLKIAGVDLETSAPFEKMASVMNQVLAELESLQ